jgi:bloom syndrome protein
MELDFRSLPRPIRDVHLRAVVDNEERPMDKNHQIVIDLCQSGDEQAGDESNYSFDDDDDDEDDGMNNDDDEDGGFHTSHHFTQQLDPEVEAYNRRMAEVQGARGGGRGGDGGSAATSKAPKKARQPRSSASHSKSKYPGVKKRSSFGGKKPKGGQRKSGGNGGANGGGNGGRSSWNGIMAMPT